MSFEISFIPPIGLGAIYTKTCVIDTSVTFHYIVCSKMMACTWNKCFLKQVPSFYYIHCSETWHLCQWHKFRCRRPLAEKGRKEFQWGARNLFQMTSDATHTFQCNRGLTRLYMASYAKEGKMYPWFHIDRLQDIRRKSWCLVMPAFWSARIYISLAKIKH